MLEQKGKISCSGQKMIGQTRRQIRALRAVSPLLPPSRLPGHAHAVSAPPCDGAGGAAVWSALPPCTSSAAPPPSSCCGVCVVCARFDGRGVWLTLSGATVPLLALSVDWCACAVRWCVCAVHWRACAVYVGVCWCTVCASFVWSSLGVVICVFACVTLSLAVARRGCHLALVMPHHQPHDFTYGMPPLLPSRLSPATAAMHMYVLLCTTNLNQCNWRLTNSQQHTPPAPQIPACASRGRRRFSRGAEWPTPARG
jgi:hypothetical protein